SYDARYNSQGGFVLQPFTATDSASNKNLLQTQIDTMTLESIGGGTPITESMVEAWRYITGKRAVNGAPVVAPNVCVKTEWQKYNGKWSQVCVERSEERRVGKEGKTQSW